MPKLARSNGRFPVQCLLQSTSGSFGSSRGRDGLAGDSTITCESAATGEKRDNHHQSSAHSSTEGFSTCFLMIFITQGRPGGSGTEAVAERGPDISVLLGGRLMGGDSSTSTPAQMSSPQANTTSSLSIQEASI